MFQSSVDMDKKIQKEQQVYKRIKLLGTGAYGKAYLVKQIKTDHSFVIKQIIMADMSQDEQQNALRQAKILEALSHPNVIKFKQVYRTSKMRLNIVMEYADEGDLALKIKQAKKESRYFEQTQILDWFTQICLGIKHIHDRKIIHRDLKAQNIFMNSDKIIKIGDFGVSRVLEKTVMNARTVVGSPYYLSPEIIENKPYSFQTDIWSLGALLYEMCALSPPFVANNLQFLALKIVKGAYGQIPSHYSYDLKSLIKSMLNTDSSKRPNINKILTSKVISKRIASFLTESKRIDQFSHTVIHNKHILGNNLPKDQTFPQQALKSPPNLIDIEKNMENKSQIYMSNVNFEIEAEVKSRPFTPQIRQNQKGPNNFFNNKNKNSSKKNLPQQIDKKFSQHNLNLNDLIQIKPSALEQKVKLPKVHTNPTIFDRRQSEACIKKNNSGLENLPEKQIPPVTAFLKKRVQSKDIFSNNAVVQAKKQLEKVDQEQFKGEDNAAGKWKKPPKVLSKIQTPPANVDNATEQKTSHISLLHSKEPPAQQQIQRKKQQQQSKQTTGNKIVNRSASTKQITNIVKKNVAKKEVKSQKEKKTPMPPKKTARKQSQDGPSFEVVSEEMKKKAIVENQKEMIRRRSTSKSKADKKKVLPKKSIAGEINTGNNIKKQPAQAKTAKKPAVPPKPQQKLSQPPRLEFQNTQQFESSQTKQQTIHDIYYSSLVEEEKCNSDRDSQGQVEQMYTCQDFEQYEENDSKLEEDMEEEEGDGSQEGERLSLDLSDSCRPGNQNNNFNRMISEMENINNMIAKAQGAIVTLPVFGHALNAQNLLELSQPVEEILREDDTDLESLISEHPDTINQKQNPAIQSQQPDEPSQIRSNSSDSSHCQTNTNLTLFSNQEHLETLKMNLEELFGEENIIFIHQSLCEVVEKEGLDFNEKDIQRMILFQKPDINPVLLRKFFRLIVTVVVMEQQENAVE